MAQGARRRVHGAGRARLPPRPERRPAAPGRLRTTARTIRRSRGRWCRADPRTSHASVWMYLERIPLVVYGAGVQPSDSEERVSLADVAPTIAELIGFDDFLDLGREGRPLPGISRPADRPGDRRDVRDRRRRVERPPGVPRRVAQPEAPDARRRELPQRDPRLVPGRHGVGARHDRHRRVPRTHGITGHNLRDGTKARKAYGELGHANPGDILVPTLADLWSDATDNRAWVGELGYQVWHLGMLGSRRTRRDGVTSRPVAVYWDETGDPQDWRSQNEELYRLPTGDAACSTRSTAIATRYSPNPARNPEFDPVKPKNLHCCSTPVIRYQGDLVEATLANEPIGSSGRARTPVHQLQGARLHGPRLRDVRPDDGRRAARRRRAARPARGAAGCPLSGPVRADRHGRPRPVPAPRRRRAASVSTRSSSGTTSSASSAAACSTSSRTSCRPRCTCTRTCCGTPARRARTWPRSSATTRTGGTSGRTCPGTRSSRSCSIGSSSPRCSRPRSSTRWPAATWTPTSGPASIRKPTIGIRRPGPVDDPPTGLA